MHRREFERSRSKPSPQTPRANVTWTIGGAGAGFGIGLWAGLKAFDDSINSERKVWSTAVVGAAVGAVGGYLIGRARARHAGVSRRSRIPLIRRIRHNPALPRVRSIRELRTLDSPTTRLGLIWSPDFRPESASTQTP